MSKMRSLVVAVVAASLAGTLPAHAADADVALSRLDCGGSPEPRSVAAFSDTYAYPDLALQLTYGCYLVRHGDRYMVWDTGKPADGSPGAAKASLVDQLAQAGIAATDVGFVGISHYHNDHTGQLASFHGATLVIGQGDWAAVRPEAPPDGVPREDHDRRRAPFAHWTSGDGTVEPLRSPQHDVFGDGSVVMIGLPGHTPGHYGLLVRLEERGNVLLTGDVTHFHENYDTNGVPEWNTDRADSLASLARFKEIADNLEATVVIQHDPRDVDKLPAFPEFAE
ncbi:MAG TPA: N-acyl homoserine lactonase family protein [Xanthomonadaceae bacterium]|nr:N-acyl homoserine lactonase family protein [Xanthomonadaceae bacterium]